MASATAATPNQRAAMRLTIPRSPQGGASVELRVRLSSHPSPGEDSVSDLVTGSSLVLRVALAAAIEAVGSAASNGYFRSIRFELLGRGMVLAAAEAKGSKPEAVLQAQLDRANTMHVIRSLAGRGTPLEVSATGAHLRTPFATIRIGLNELLRDVTANDGAANLDPWVALTAPNSSTGSYTAIPRRFVHQSRDLSEARPVVAAMGRGFATISAVSALSVVSAAPATAVAIHPAYVAAHPYESALNSHLVLPPPDTRPRIPRIEDTGAEIWPDYVEASFWYVPSFELVQPDPSRPASESPMLYRFSESGHDVQGQPGLNATITFTLRQVVGDAVNRRLAELGNPPAKPVPLDNMAVSLTIPFRDSQGQNRREIFTATTVRKGDLLIATTSLLDNWARLAYGALAVAGFQQEPARVQVDMYFDAMVAQSTRPSWFGVTPKYDVLPVRPIPERSIDATLTLGTGLADVQFARERPGEARALRPLSMAQNIAVHGRLHNQALETQIVAEPIYAEQSVAKQRQIPCLFPCETLGAFYLQITDDGDVPVGCREALRLGQTDYRLYAPVEDVRIPKQARVLRSLLQPGRFLIAPLTYKIARLGPEAGDRAFHPSVFLYSSLDPSAPENNRAAFMASLGPDIAAHEVERIRDLLRELSPAPVLEWLTGIAATIDYTWSLPNGEIVKDRAAIRRWDSFQVSMMCDLEQVPLLEAMLNNSGVELVAAFALPDGSSIRTTLDLSLNGIVGPVGRTPIDVTRSPGGATLLNRIDCDVNVDDLLVVDDAAPAGHPAVTTVPVERTLAPGASAEIQASIPASARLVPAAVPAQTGATLAEIRSFVEDIFTQVVFLNLLNFANHNLSSVALEARIVDLPEQYHAALNATDSVAEVQMVLPLTRYLAHPALQFQATLTRHDGSVQTTAWIVWPLNEKGNVVGINWELLGLSN
jgi:hypothetical protein